MCIIPAGLRYKRERTSRGKRDEKDAKGVISTQAFHEILLKLSFLLNLTLYGSRFWHKVHTKCNSTSSKPQALYILLIHESNAVFPLLDSVRSFLVFYCQKLWIWSDFLWLEWKHFSPLPCFFLLPFVSLHSTFPKTKFVSYCIHWFFRDRLSASGLWGTRGTRANPSWHWMRGTPWTSRQLITGQHTHRDKQPYTLTFSRMGNVESPVNLLTCTSLSSTRREPMQTMCAMRKRKKSWERSWAVPCSGKNSLLNIWISTSALISHLHYYY